MTTGSSASPPPAPRSLRSGLRRRLRTRCSSGCMLERVGDAPPWMRFSARSRSRRKTRPPSRSRRRARHDRRTTRGTRTVAGGGGPRGARATVTRIRSLLRSFEATWLGPPLLAILVNRVWRRGFLDSAKLRAVDYVRFRDAHGTQRALYASCCFSATPRPERRRPGNTSTCSASMRCAASVCARIMAARSSRASRASTPKTDLAPPPPRDVAANTAAARNDDGSGSARTNGGSARSSGRRGRGCRALPAPPNALGGRYDATAGERSHAPQARGHASKARIF